MTAWRRSIGPLGSAVLGLTVGSWPPSARAQSAAARDTLGPSDVAAAASMAEMGRFFDPPPGTEVRPSESELGSLPIERHVEARGEIWVRGLPPKTCLAIIIHEDRPTERVCTDRAIAFRVGDINAQGEIVWRIGTDTSPHKAILKWPTHYRIAQVIPEGRVPQSMSLPVLVHQCERVPGTRTLRLKTSDRFGQWIFKFPESDRFAPQPKKSPNLYMQEEKGGLKGAKDRQAEAAAEKEQAAAAGEAVPKADEGPKVIPVKKRREISSDPTLYWAVPARHSYQLPASAVIIDDAPPGQRGSCHYRWHGAPEDPNSGIIECHHIAGYDVILTPLTCAGDFMIHR